MSVPFYDPTKTYEENYRNGPYGDFVDGKNYYQKGEPTIDFLGEKIYTPFGIPAGPLINSDFCNSAFEKGFDVCVYKTVRSSSYPCHPYPNILAVKIDGQLTLDKAKNKLIADGNFQKPISITNSFGVPSKDISVWQKDVQKAISYEGDGQVLILSFMGTVKENQTSQEFINDWAITARKAKETGAKILEVNLSCPNIGNEGLVCYNLKMTEKICKIIRSEIGDSSLILKVGYYTNDRDLKKLAEIAAKYGQAISSINTIQAEIIDRTGKHALPGESRTRSGVCGAGIKWAGLDMVKRLKEIRNKNKMNWSIIGVGGVTEPKDYFEYRDLGADCVMSATGAMWDPYLAQEIKSNKISL